MSTADLGLHGPEEPPVVCAADLGEGWTDRPWRLGLCRDGALSIRRHGEQSFNGVARPVAYAWEKEPLQMAHVDFGRLWPERDQRLTYEDGHRYSAPLPPGKLLIRSGDAILLALHVVPV
ncbi:hypothetical protein [Nonomuraea sp. NPDC049758]|uniref:hypothetical protein n=1 Tax=Nonomuraea sp. NPDC049758 TaxID=3154360 RepID=UPI00341A4517